MRCNICGDEVCGEYRVLKLSYEIEETPPKKSPFREVEKTVGFQTVSGDIGWTWGDYRVLGTEYFVDEAKVCSNCIEKLDNILEQIKELFIL